MVYYFLSLQTKSPSESTASSKKSTENNASGVKKESPMKPLSPPSYGMALTSQPDVRVTASATTMVG